MVKQEHPPHPIPPPMGEQGDEAGMVFKCTWSGGNKGKQYKMVHNGEWKVRLECVPATRHSIQTKTFSG